MLNRVILMGRLTADPELRKTASDLSVTSFTLAVDRNYGKGADRQTGSIQVRNYTDKNDNKRQAVEVLVDQAFFADSKNSSNTSSAVDDFGPPPPTRSNGSSYSAAPSPFQQPAQASGFGYSNGAAEEFEEVGDDEEDLPF